MIRSAAHGALLAIGAVLKPAVAAVPEQAPAVAARSMPADPRGIAAIVDEAATRFAIPPRWIYAVMRRESGGNPRAVSPKGASGLMQIMPWTWAGLRVRYRLGTDVFDPHDNILAGAAYLRELYDRYGSPGFLAAYNAGPGRYEAWVRDRKPLPEETVAYVSAVGSALDTSTSMPRITAAQATLDWSRSALFVGGKAGHSGEDSAARDAASITKSESPAWGLSGSTSLFASIGRVAAPR